MPEAIITPDAETPAATEQENSELRYLLSAYLFDSLSEEGRLEVERQLENSESCRQEFEELRETLSILNDALDPSSAPSGAYCFDEKRMERVLAASCRKRPLRLPARPALVSAAAGVLLFIGIAIPFMVSRIQSTSPQLAHNKWFAGSEIADDSESAITETMARIESRSYMRAERPSDTRDAENRPTGKPRLLAPKTISEPRAPPSEKDLRKRGVAAVKIGLTEPGSPTVRARTGSTAPASSPGETPSEGNFIIDAIGIGGGAAGSYGKRFGKGREAETGEKDGAQAARTPRDADKKEKTSDASASSQGDRKDLFYKKSLAKEAAPTREEEESELIEFEDSLQELAEERPPEQEKLREQGKRPQPLVKRRIAVDGESRSFDQNQSAGLREELKKLDSLAENQQKKQEATVELAAKDNSAGRSSSEKRLLRQLAQSSLQAPRNGQNHFRKNKWAYNLNIAEAENGYASHGKGTLARQHANKAQQAREPGVGPVEINEKALNSYAWYRRMDPNLSYEQFDSRALTIPAPALGDEGLGEKGFREKYGVNPFVATSRDHLSTFGMDVDNASWGRTLETIREQNLPPPETVRVEEFINNFPDSRPGNPDSVFTVYTEGGPAPFGDHDVELIQVTIKSRDLLQGERRDAILTFAIDTSGSMADNGKLQLLKDSIRTLVSNLAANDRVAIVAFSTNAYVVLPHTSVRQKNEIDAAIDSLEANGGTNVEAGIDLAYRLAAESGNRRAANRVILCSDGVANLGAKGPEAVLKRIRRYARDNLVSLFTYAFGTGGRQAVRGDRMLQRLADEGDGRYQYVDSASTARDIFSLPDQLQILASDAKIQVDFNPDVVSHYRLLGYEKRDIADKDFRNDKVDAGEVGPGATVTALYEIKRSRPVGSLGRIRLRYLDTVSGRVEETDFELPPGILSERLRDTSDRFRMIASVAEFAELLRGSYYARNGSYGAILELMSGFSPEAKNRLEFAEIYRTVGKAQGLCAIRTLQNIKE